MEIVITDSITVESEGVSLDVFDKYGNVTKYDLTSYEETAERVRNAEVILCNKTPLNRETLKYAEKLRYIGLFATGYNNVELDYIKEKGVVLSNAAGYSTDAVAQHVFALILHFYNNVSEYDKTVRNGDWINSRTFSYFTIPLYELLGKTIGIIGFGTIGKKVAEIAKVFGMNVIVSTRTRRDGEADYVSFDELLARSDIITLHCPLTDETNKLIDEKAFSKMKKTAVFINTARGPVVDEKALCHALKSGMILGAGIDVLEKEPMERGCVLQGLPNLVTTPHVAWAGVETRKRLISIVEDNLHSFLLGNLKNVVGT